MIRHSAYAACLAALLLVPASGTLVISFYVLVPFFLAEWLSSGQQTARMFRVALFLGTVAWVCLFVQGWFHSPMRMLLSALLLGTSAIVAFVGDKLVRESRPNPALKPPGKTGGQNGSVSRAQRSRVRAVQERSD